MQIIKIALLVLLFPFSSMAKRTVADFALELGFEKGSYRLKKGPRDSCLSGKFEMHETLSGVVFLKVDGAPFIKNLSSGELENKDQECREVVKNERPGKNQIKHSLTQICPNFPEFKKIVTMTFSSNEIKYNMTVSGPVDQTSDCVLKRKKDR